MKLMYILIQKAHSRRDRPNAFLVSYADFDELRNEIAEQQRLMMPRNPFEIPAPKDGGPSTQEMIDNLIPLPILTMIGCRVFAQENVAKPMVCYE